jgi:hypothetical protein
MVEGERRNKGKKGGMREKKGMRGKSGMRVKKVDKSLGKAVYKSVQRPVHPGLP